MDSSHQTNASAHQDRSLQPHHAGRSMGTRGELHDQYLDQHPAQGQVAGAENAQAHRHLGASRSRDASGVAGSSVSTDDADAVVAMGGGSGADRQPMAEKVQRRGSNTAGGELNRNDVIRLIERQKFRCALSGWPLTPQTAALDHIVAVTRGGQHQIDNVQVLHKDVNRAKGTMTNEEFIALCGAVWQLAKPSR